MGKKRNSGVYPYKLVLVEWEDSQQPVSRWQWVDEFNMPSPVGCVSVGFLIAQNEHALALSPNLGDLDQTRHQGCGVIRIPVKAVTRMIDL